MNISSFTKCANCGACINICPVRAISVEEKDLFYRPVVDEERCIDCGKCAELCPVEHLAPASNVTGAYSAVHKDQLTVSKSSSGGAFSALAENVLKKNGVVYGAVFDDSYKKIFFASTDEFDLESLRRSKYAESLVGEVFGEIKGKLEEGREVLFCGTPCQAAGLRAFLDRDYDNLLICDFSCGGLPSHKIYFDYLDSLESKYRAEISNVNFRPKTYGWRRHSISVCFENGKEYLRLAERDPYFSAFLNKQLSVRDYCLQCGFADNHRSDIILADFWLTEKITGKPDNDTGISLIITNTKKGEEAVSALEQMTLIPLDPREAGYNLKPRKPSADNIEIRKAYLEEFERSGSFAASAKYSTAKGISDLKLRVKEKLKKI